MRDIEVTHEQLGGEGNDYCLGVKFKDAMMSMLTNHYDESNGNWFMISLHRMTPADILALGNAITIEAYKAKAQQERKGGEPCQTPS